MLFLGGRRMRAKNLRRQLSERVAVGATEAVNSRLMLKVSVLGLRVVGADASLHGRPQAHEVLGLT